MITLIQFKSADFKTAEFRVYKYFFIFTIKIIVKIKQTRGHI